MRRRSVVLLLTASVAVFAGVALWWSLRAREHPTRSKVPPLRRIISDAEKDKIPAAANRPWGEYPVDKIKSLHGKTEAEVVAELGEPNQTYEFSLEDGVGEFQVELLNTYPLEDPRSRGVRIREWQWKYREFSVAVWFHLVDGQWVALDTCRWKKGVVF